MNKHIFFQNILLIIIGVALISLTIGLKYYEYRYDLLSSISKSNTKAWDVYIDNLSNDNTNIDEDSIYEPVSIKLNSNIISLDAYFKSGDYYEFDIDAINEGTKHAILNSIYLLGTEDRSLKCEITYPDGKEVSPQDLLIPSKKETMHFKIYRTGNDAKEKQYQVSLVLTYIQK